MRSRSGWWSMTTSEFVHAGANLSDADKAKLKKLNEEDSTLSNAFTTKLLAATKAAAYTTTDKSALAGLERCADRGRGGGGEGAQAGGLRAAAAEHDAAAGSWRAERTARRGRRSSRTRGTAPSAAARTTRAATIARLAQLRAEKAKLLGFPNYAAWNAAKTRWRRRPRPR